MRSDSTVATAYGRRYMIQLCKHFGHKTETSFDDVAGHIRFEAGEVRLRPAADGLVLTAEAATPDSLDRLERVIESHLKRFTFREPDLAIAWTRAG